MTGAEYIKSNYIKEIPYGDAVKMCVSELLEMLNGRDLYEADDIYDSPIYPRNAELYDEMCDEYGFVQKNFLVFFGELKIIIRRIRI